MTMLAAASFLCGLIFGFGLLISGMTQPTKVLGFLDVLGRWDPTLGFVMAGALAVAALGFVLAKRRVAPLFAAQSLWPTRTDIDGRLVGGATLFGIGWGMVGLCPGPALENLATLWPPVIVFVIAMAIGMILQDVWQRRTPSPVELEDAALATSPDG
jgi:uncharacterized membrane protein YedE/YeeE